MDQFIPVTIVIADRTYRLRIHPKDEEVLRKTVKLINEKVIEFKTQFAGKDMQDYIAMVLVWFATEQNASMKNQLQIQSISEGLLTIERMLDQGLANQ